MSNSMINPSIVELLGVVNSRYTLVTMASKRARQLTEGKETLLDEDTLKEINTTKPVTIAIHEIMNGLLTYETVKEGIK
ncbi:MAG: DNA-directed RNA polymerase subunit omega [Clostridiaceae bacterium]